MRAESRLPRSPRCLLALPRRRAAAQPRDTLTIGITQYPSTFHPNIENMAAKSYVLGFARRPLTAYDADWQLTCLTCETLPTLENGVAERETTPDGKPGIRVTYRLRDGLRWGDGTPVTRRGPPLRLGGRARRRHRLRPRRILPQRLRAASWWTRAPSRCASTASPSNTPRWATSSRCPRISSARAGRPTRAPTAPAPPTTPRPTNPGLWNGPYRITGVQPGASVTLDRNPAWTGAAPAFRRITIRTVENTPALEAQLLAGPGRHDRRRARPADRTGHRAGTAHRQPLPLPLPARPDLRASRPAASTTPRCADRRVRRRCCSRSTARRSSSACSTAGSRWRIPPSTRSTRCTTRTCAQWPFDLARAARAAGRGRLDARPRRHPPQRRRRAPLARVHDHRRQPRARSGAAGAAGHVARRPASRRASATSRRACSSARPCRAAASRGWRCSPGSARRRPCRAPRCTPTRSRARSATGPARTTAASAMPRWTC